MSFNWTNKVEHSVFSHRQASPGRRRPPRPGFPNSHALYPRSLLTNYEGRGRKLGRPRRLKLRARASKIQDGEDGDVPRSPDCKTKYQGKTINSHYWP